MKKLILFFTLISGLFFASRTYAQVSIGGNPVSYNDELRNNLEAVPFIQTPILNMTVIEAEDAQWEAERAAGMIKIGRRFGIEHTVDYGLYNSGLWSCLPNGGRLWRLGIECPEALSINLIFDQYRLPEGATLYIFSEDHRDKIGGFTNYNNQADNFFATDIVISSKIIVEYYQPANVDFDGDLHLSTIIHGYRGPGAFGKAFGQSGSCQRNVKCPEGEGWEDQIRSVFALFSGGTELCSGSILNNTAQDGKPYALTANHCWTAASNPSVWIFRFNWQSPTCTPSQNSSYQSMTGSTLKMKTPTSTSSTDCCLVELNQPIPADYNVYYAGWSRATPTGTGTIIHHPSLDIKKFTQGTLSIVTQYVQGYRIDFAVGGACTEGGSSGSPLFDANHRVIGQEYGGESYCGAPASKMFDVWGRFDISWNYGTSSSTRLKDWLDPLGLDPETLDGYDPNGSSVVDAELQEIIIPEATYYFTNKIEPKVVVKNNGDRPITAASLVYKVDNGSPETLAWTGSIAAGAVAEITLKAFTPAYGTHTFTATVTVANDEMPANDSKTKNFEVKNCIEGHIYPDFLSEGFENNGNLPDCWQAPTTNRATWTFEREGGNGTGNPAAPHAGSYNARFYSATTNDEALLITPPINLEGGTEPPVLSFYHAQAKNQTAQDKLQVLYKNDPDASWKLIKEFNTDIREWKREYLLLPSLSNVYWIAFKGISGKSQGVVLDDVKVLPAPKGEPVKKVEVNKNGNDVLLTWEKPDNEDAKMVNIYCDDALLGSVGIDMPSFRASAFANAEHTFCVAAVYPDYSWATETETVCALYQPVGINESSTSDISIYPNPANTEIMIKGTHIQTVEVYDVQGRLLYSQKSTTPVNVTKFATGTYFIKIYTEDGHTNTQQINIAH